MVLFTNSQPLLTVTPPELTIVIPPIVASLNLYNAYLLLLARTGANVAVVSSTPSLTLVAPLTKVVSPVLSASLPLNNLIIPLVPVLITGDPETIIFPPIASPILLDCPALIVTALVVVLSVFMLLASVISPFNVATAMVPEAVIPVLVNAPIVKPPLASTSERLPSFEDDEPPERVAILLEVLVSVYVPVPFRSNPLAVRAADCVTATAAYKLMLLLVAVKAELMVMLLPYMFTGPAIEMALSCIMSAILPAFPMVNPPIPLLS